MQHRLAGVVAEGHVLQRDRAPHAPGGQRARLVDDGERDVEHLEDPLPRRHRALHDAVLDGERADRVEEALDVEHEGDHHAEFQRAVEHQRPSEHDDDRERRSGQGVDDGNHHLGVSGRTQMGAQVLRRLVAVEHEVHVFPAHSLDGADGVDRFGERPVGDGVGLAGPAEGDPRARQPDHPDHGQRRNQHQRQQPELGMERQHDDHDADQEQEIAEGRNRVLEELLKRIHVALETGHHPPDLRLVHEGQRNVLEMGEHGAAKVEDHVLADMPHQPVLHVVGAVADQDHEPERGGGKLQLHDVAALGEDRVIDRMADDQRDRELGARKHQHGTHGKQEPPHVGPDEDGEAACDTAVVGRAEYLLVAADLRADDGTRRPGRLCGGAHSAAPCNPPATSSRLCSAKIFA